jgi:hypothetical protein
VKLVKWIALALAGFLAAAPLEARADQEPDASLAPAKVDPKALDRTYHHALARRNIGIGLTVPGLALTILGGVLIGYGVENPHLFGGGAEIASGSVAAGVGLAIGIPGIVLWILGQDDMDVASWRKKQLVLPVLSFGRGAGFGGLAFAF